MTDFEKLQKEVDNAFAERDSFIESVEPPLSEDEQAKLDRLNRLTLEAFATLNEARKKQD